MVGNSRHIYIISKVSHGSGMDVVKTISRGSDIIRVDLISAFSKIMNESKKGDCLVFHTRDALTDSILFLAYNKVAKRNKIAYNPHTNLRPTTLNMVFLNMFIDTVICLTAHNKRRIERTCTCNIVVIPNPIPFERLKNAKAQRYNKSKKKEYDFVWAGRDVYFKRVEIYIRIFKNIKNISGLLLTDKLSGDKKAMLDEINNVKLVEGLNGKEFFSELIKGKVCVVTSDDDEGFPVFILELVALGFPFILADTTKFREILMNEGVYWKDEAHLHQIIKDIKSGKLKVNPIPDHVAKAYSPEAVTQMYERL